jgi:hypothetical protein
MIRPHRPSIGEHIPPIIKSMDNPNRGEDLMMWTLAQCNENVRRQLFRGWTVGGSIDARQLVEIGMIAGLVIGD